MGVGDGDEKVIGVGDGDEKMIGVGGGAKTRTASFGIVNAGEDAGEVGGEAMRGKYGGGGGE